MKKIILLSAIWVLSLSTAKAQDYKHELSLGLGIFSTSQFVDAFTDVLVSAFPSYGKISNATSYGAWHADYRYLINHRWAVGGTFVFDYEDAEGVLKNTVQEQIIGNFYRYHYTLAAEGDFRYISREKFTFYSSLGIGATLYNQVYRELNSSSKSTHNTVHLNFQVTPIGVKYGNHWGGFLEIGFGYRGIANAGVFYRL